MLRNKLTQSVLLALGMVSVTVLPNANAADVPAGTKLAKTQELVRGNGTEVASIDPHKVEGTPEANVIRDLFEGLVNQDAKGNIIPGVAESWETTDNQHYVFHLRKDAKWSNGDPVTANDFVYSFQRAVDPNTASPYAWYLELARIQNAADIIAGKADKKDLAVKALDDQTLVIDLEMPVPFFTKMLAHGVMKPVHQATVEKYGDKWTKPENFVGNGAYELSKWVVNERMELKRNPEYWDDAKTVINKVTFLPIENPVAEMNRFLSGEIQMTASIPIEHFKRLKKENPESLNVKGSLCTYYYSFNMTKPPFNDARVRKALSYAIDRDIISNAILGSGQKPAYLFTPEITAGFSGELPEYAKLTQKQRNEEAKKLLKEAGFDKNHPLNFTMIYNTSENHKKLATVVQSMWKKNLGVNMQLENQEWKTFLDNRAAGNFEVSRAGWCGDYNEPSSFLSLMQSNNTSNDPKYKSAEYDAVMEKAARSTSEEERSKLYAQAEALLARDMPVAPVYQYVSTRLVSPKLGGYPSENAEDVIYAKDMYVKQ